MDWELVVERNTKALRRILATLIAMAGLPVGESPPLRSAISESPPLRGRCPAGQRGVPGSGGQFTFFPLEGAQSQNQALAEKSKLSPALTLPRRLHRAILRLLRPLESATRRLIIIAARDLPVPDLPPLRPREPKPDMKAAHAALRSLGLAVVLSSAEVARLAAEKRAAEKRAAARAARAGRPPAFPLLDPLKRFGRPRRRYVPAHAAPRILSFDGAIPHRLPPPPGPHDLIDATRLSLRLAGISHALADLPAQAQRFARWKARRSRSPFPLRGSEGRARQAARPGRVRGGGSGVDGKAIPPPRLASLRSASAARRPSPQGGGWTAVRTSPLRPGRAPGWRTRSKDEINEILADLQYFAREVLRPPDTS